MDNRVQTSTRVEIESLDTLIVFTLEEKLVNPIDYLPVSGSIISGNRFS